VSGLGKLGQHRHAAPGGFCLQVRLGLLDHAPLQVEPMPREVTVLPFESPYFGAPQTGRGGDSDHHLDRRGLDSVQDRADLGERQDVWLGPALRTLADVGDGA